MKEWSYKDGIYTRSVTHSDMVEFLTHDVVSKRPSSYLRKLVQVSRANERYRYIRNNIDRMPEAPVMYDIGCAEGYTMKAFDDDGWIATGCDVSVKMQDMARKYGTIIWNESLYTKHMGWKFDVIVMAHIIEHMEYPVAFIQNKLEFLNDDGVLYIEVPTAPQIDEVDTHTLMRALNHGAGHVYEFTVSGFKSMLSELDVDIVSMQRIFHNVPDDYSKEIGYILMKKNPCANIKHIPRIAWDVCRFFMAAWLFDISQREIQLDSKWLGLGDFIRCIVKKK